MVVCSLEFGPPHPRVNHLCAGPIGRTNLCCGDYDTLIISIVREVLTLPDEMVVYSGHGPATTVGAERATNPFLQG